MSLHIVTLTGVNYLGEADGESEHGVHNSPEPRAARNRAGAAQADQVACDACIQTEATCEL